MRNGFRKLTALWVIAFVLALVSALSAAPPARSVRIAVLTPGLAFGEVLAGFRDGLDKLGYREGSNLTLLVEDTKGMGPEVKAQAQALVAAKPDVVVTIGTSHTVAAKAATSTIPTVFTWVGDPVKRAWSPATPRPATTSRASRCIRVRSPGSAWRS